MSDLAEGVRALPFFIGFMPSFSRIGYCIRRIGWDDHPPDFSGQRWLVTGASTGIGREIARAAAANGAQVLAVARSTAGLAALAADCAGGPGRVEPCALDLSLLSNVDRLLQDLLPRFGSLDTLVNNVGVLTPAPAWTTEGLEFAFATNLLNPWLLTRGVLAAGLLAESGVIIHMSSGGMYNVALELRRLETDPNWTGALAYARHKRAQVVLNAHLAEQLARGGGQRSYVMHPGWVATPGVASAMPLFNAALGPLLRTPAEGADTALWLADRRPPGSGGIWFDRAERPAHVFPGTRGGDSVEALSEFLSRRAQAARAVSTGAATG